MLEALWPYATVCGAAFLAATILPFASELVLAGHITAGLGDKWTLVGAASVGNVAGSAVNWWLGTQLRRFEQRRWFPVTPAQIERAAQQFRRWGVWSLLFAWVPVVGDPLTVVAGTLRVPFALFLPLVAIGKVARYVVLATAL
jgi:membrane protein YqaA with SNARE-associated domain